MRYFDIMIPRRDPLKPRDLKDEALRAECCSSVS